MNEQFLIDLGLDEKAVEAIMTAYGESLEDYVKKSDYAVLEAERDSLLTQQNKQKAQLDKLKSQVADNKEVKEQLDELQRVSAADKEKYEGEISSLKLTYAINDALKTAKSRNNKAVMALLDYDKLAIDGDKVRGLDEQIKDLQESNSFLFELAPKPADGKPSVPVKEGEQAVEQERSGKSLGQEMAEAYNASVAF